jgi:hypothetical protein
LEAMTTPVFFSHLCFFPIFQTTGKAFTWYRPARTQPRRVTVSNHQLYDSVGFLYFPSGPVFNAKNSLKLETPLNLISRKVYNGSNQTKPQFPHSRIPQTTFSRDARQILPHPPHFSPTLPVYAHRSDLWGNRKSRSTVQDSPGNFQFRFDRRKPSAEFYPPGLTPRGPARLGPTREFRMGLRELRPVFKNSRH